MAEPPDGDEEVVDVGDRGRRHRRWVFDEQSDRVHTDPAVLGDPQGHIVVGPMTLLAEQLVGGGDAGPPCAGVRLQRVLVRDQPVRVCLESCWFVYQRAPTPPGGCYSPLSLSLASGGILRFRCHRG